MSVLNELGQEIFDETPIECPIKFSRPMPLHLRIRAQILQALQGQKENAEFETEEEANDFDMEDNSEFNSPYEMEDDFDHLTNPDPDKNIPIEKESSAEDQQVAQSPAAPEAE